MSFSSSLLSYSPQHTPGRTPHTFAFERLLWSARTSHTLPCNPCTLSLYPLWCLGPSSGWWGRLLPSPAALELVWESSGHTHCSLTHSPTCRCGIGSTTCPSLSLVSCRCAQAAPEGGGDGLKCLGEFETFEFCSCLVFGCVWVRLGINWHN